MPAYRLTRIRSYPRIPWLGVPSAGVGPVRLGTGFKHQLDTQESETAWYCSKYDHETGWHLMMYRRLAKSTISVRDLIFVPEFPLKRFQAHRQTPVRRFYSCGGEWESTVLIPSTGKSIFEWSSMKLSWYRHVCLPEKIGLATKPLSQFSILVVAILV